MQPLSALQPDDVPTPAAPDATLLIRRARDGDRGAFAQIYRLHVDRIHGLCLRLTADPEEAAGCCQDAFVRAWEKLPQFRGDSRFGTWLHRLTANVVWDRRRARLRRQGAGEPDPDDPVRATLDRTGERLDLETAVAALPTGARTVFVLHDVEGYRLREIATLQGIAVGTVKSQLHRARALLREVLS